MKRINSLLRRCKTLSRQLGRTSSFNGLRSKSTRYQEFSSDDGENVRDRKVDHWETVYVGSTRRRYVISSKYLTHPLLNALIEKSRGQDSDLWVKCEVVLFEHLLWMLENADPNLGSDSLEELAGFYVQ